MEQSYYRIEAQKDSPPVVRQVWREAEQVIAGRYAVFLLRIRQERADFSPLLDWLAAHGEEADAVYAEELGLQLFPYMDDYACEVRAHLKEKRKKGLDSGAAPSLILCGKGDGTLWVTCPSGSCFSGFPRL